MENSKVVEPISRTEKYKLSWSCRWEGVVWVWFVKIEILVDIYNCKTCPGPEINGGLTIIYLI